MALTDLLARLLGFGADAAEDELPPQVAALLPELVDLVVDIVEPKLRFAAGYRAKLEASLRRTIVHMRRLAVDLPQPIPMSAAAWVSDPHLNAYFATRGDLVACMARSDELRAFFGNPAASGPDEAVAVLAMQRVERHILGMAMEGGMLRCDVPQTTVSFTDPRLAIPGADVAAMRREFGTRILRRLANIAMERIEAIQARGHQLADRQALLETRRRRLQARGAALEPLIGGSEGSGSTEVAELEADLAQIKADLRTARDSLGCIEQYLDQVNQVFSVPEEHIKLVTTPLRVSRTGIKVEGPTDEVVNELVVTEITVGADTRAIALVQCARAELPPKEDLLARGAGLL